MAAANGDDAAAATQCLTVLLLDLVSAVSDALHGSAVDSYTARFSVVEQLAGAVYAVEQHVDVDLSAVTKKLVQIQDTF